MLDKSATDFPKKPFFNGCDGNVFGVNFVFDADDDGQLILGSMSGSNVSDLIGIASGAILDTATGTINTWGSRNEVQTGLTIGSDYYAQTDGTITTSSSGDAQLLGKALSATQINIKDYTG